MSSDRERIIEFDASTSIPADGWFAIDSTTEGTRKIQKSAIIGSGSLDTTSQEVIGAINEVNQRAATIDSMTQDEYDNLPSTKESDNVPRFITDGVPTFDETLWNKVGEDPLDTTAQDCSGAINELKSAFVDYFGKEFEATASTERDFILNVMVQAYTYLVNNSLPFIFCKVSWTNNNSGYAILSSNRRFQIQIGDSMSLGVLNSAGTALANLRSVTTTAHA
jgi:hypothetical protein